MLGARQFGVDDGLGAGLTEAGDELPGVLDQGRAVLVAVYDQERRRGGDGYADVVVTPDR